MRRIAVVALVGCAIASMAAQQGAPAFEVASIKVAESGQRGASFYGAQASGFSASNVPLSMLIESAYDVQPYQLAGGPEWIRRERFTVAAKYPAGWSLERNGRTEAMQMVQRLLADRFTLRVHKETRDGLTYALVMAREDRRLGPKLRPDAETCGAGSTRDGKATGFPPCMMLSTPRSLQVNGHPLSVLASRLSAIIGAPVVDRTGLTGIFDAELQWTPVESASSQGGDSVSLFTALQEQLGLRLESYRGPVDVLVIDSVEQPTAD